mmetsp:Transcript_26093/g.77795  ORF Transcript_26093/g.77795 Transcript_26093/m.77795 type:complete len:229 (-) Transcript_26093:75-761(-)
MPGGRARRTWSALSTWAPLSCSGRAARRATRHRSRWRPATRSTGRTATRRARGRPLPPCGRERSPGLSPPASTCFTSTRTLFCCETRRPSACAPPPRAPSLETPRASRALRCAPPTSRSRRTIWGLAGPSRAAPPTTEQAPSTRAYFSSAPPPPAGASPRSGTAMSPLPSADRASGARRPTSRSSMLWCGGSGSGPAWAGGAASGSCGGCTRTGTAISRSALCRCRSS